MTRSISREAPPGATPDFDRIARIYKWMEWLSFGPLLGRCRRAFLPRMTSRRRALIIGDGDGRFTASLLRSNPNINIDAVDASRAMLNEMLRRTQPHHARVHTHIADARQWQPPANVRYDLVATHFFLDCLTTPEISSLSKSIQPVLEADALWVISEFEPPRRPVRAAVCPHLDCLPLPCLRRSYRAQCSALAQPSRRAQRNRLEAARQPPLLSRIARVRSLGA